MKKLRVLSLFAGIGGVDLGLERTGGFETVAFCEIDPRARLVLAKHWPGIPCYDDVCTLTKERLAADGVAVDCIVGGFPCQDISFAGRGGGLEGKRSGLWSEFARLIGELEPGHVIVENVSALLHRGMDAVLGTLASLGYDAEWHCIPASALGAPHHRDRLWIVANRCEVGRDWSGRYSFGEHAVYDRRQWPTAPYRSWRDVVDWLKSDDARHLWQAADGSNSRVDDGLSRGLDCPAIGECGNAVVPQIPELIGRAILASLAQREAA